MKKIILPLMVGLSLSTAALAGGSITNSSITVGNGTLKRLLVTVDSGSPYIPVTESVVAHLMMKVITVPYSTYQLSACWAASNSPYYGDHCISKPVSCQVSSPHTVIAQAVPSTAGSLVLNCAK